MNSPLLSRYVGTFTAFAVVYVALLSSLHSISSVVVVDAGAVLGKTRPEKDNPQARSLAVVNKSGRKCDCFWVNTFVKPNTFVPQFVEDGVTIGISYGADKSISSYIGHEFELRELPSKRTQKCIFDECRTARVKVTDRYNQKVTLDRDFTITVENDHVRSYAKADDMFTRCQSKINEQTKTTLSPLEHIDAVTECMEEEMNTKLRDVEEERLFQSSIHRDMAADLVPFTCGNVNETQSKEIQNLTWYDSDLKKNYNIRKLHELPTSTILVVDDFVTQNYCDGLKVHHRKDNSHDDDGDTVIPLSAAFTRTENGRLLKSLLNRMFNLVMDTINWNDISVNGDILFKYLKDEIGFDTPKHLCQGTEEVANAVAAIESGQPTTCNIPGGDPVTVPTRRILIEDENNNDGAADGEHNQSLAEVFLFCDESEKKVLGALNFPYARIHITPEPGKLVIAVNRNNYADSDDDRDELDGYVNEYHLCPNHDVYVHTISKLKEQGAGVVLGDGEL